MSKPVTKRVAPFYPRNLEWMKPDYFSSLPDFEFEYLKKFEFQEVLFGARYKDGSNAFSPRFATPTLDAAKKEVRRLIKAIAETGSINAAATWLEIEPETARQMMNDVDAQKALEEYKLARPAREVSKRVVRMRKDAANYATDKDETTLGHVSADYKKEPEVFGPAGNVQPLFSVGNVVKHRITGQSGRITAFVPTNNPVAYHYKVQLDTHTLTASEKNLSLI